MLLSFFLFHLITIIKNKMQQAINIFTIIALSYTGIVFSVYIALTIRAWMMSKPIEEVNTKTPKVTVLVPCYNEDVVVAATVQSIIGQDYKGDIDIIVIDDGSTETKVLDTLKEFYKMTKKYKMIGQLQAQAYESGLNTIDRIIYDNVIINSLYEHTVPPMDPDANRRITVKVLTLEENHGKAHAMNMALSMTDTEFVYTIDADTILVGNAISRTVGCIRPDVDGLSAMVGIADPEVEEGNIPKKYINKIQWLEYLRSFVLWKTAIDDHDATLVITGAFGLFTTTSVKQIGGFKESLGEDMVLTFDLLDAGYKTQAHSEVLAYTQAPSNFTDLKSQRVRWFEGGVSNLWSHRKMIGKSGLNKYLAWFLIPFLWFADVLGVWVEAVGYTLLATIAIAGLSVDLTGILFVLGAVWALHVVQMLILVFGAYPAIIENPIKKRWRLIPLILTETLTYHYLHFIFTVIAHGGYYLGMKRGWNKFQRRS
jgi:cellulose synthase/poly-beta-1,6-N-acetylglucosamine synthase-like glycosyltransferase